MTNDLIPGRAERDASDTDLLNAHLQAQVSSMASR